MEEILQGYVIRTVPYLENDAIITLVSKTKGIVSFKARGVQKPTSKNNPSCQLFVKGEYLLDFKQEDGHRRLRSGMVEHGFSPMHYDIKRFIVLTLASEGLLKFEESDFEDAYDFINNLFQVIQSDYFDFPTTVLILLSIFMTRSGCQLTADHCVNCGRTTEISVVSIRCIKPHYI
jgi:DNA repair protein RecO